MKSMMITILALATTVASAKPVKVTYTMPSGWMSAVRYVNPGEFDGEHKLTAAEMTDAWEFPALELDAAYGRAPEGGFSQLPCPTPGAENAQAAE